MNEMSVEEHLKDFYRHQELRREKLAELRALGDEKSPRRERECRRNSIVGVATIRCPSASGHHDCSLADRSFRSGKDFAPRCLWGLERRGFGARDWSRNRDEPQEAAQPGVCRRGLRLAATADEQTRFRPGAPGGPGRRAAPGYRRALLLDSRATGRADSGARSGGAGLYALPNEAQRQTALSHQRRIESRRRADSALERKRAVLWSCCKLATVRIRASEHVEHPV